MKDTLPQELQQSRHYCDKEKQQQQLCQSAPTGLKQRLEHPDDTGTGTHLSKPKAAAGGASTARGPTWWQEAHQGTAFLFWKRLTR